jgi:putative PIN family toxin of toxin-antitoxin system
VIVFDTSTLVSAAFRRNGVPSQAVRRALAMDRIAVSEAVMTELLDVLHRPRLARFLDPGLRTELIGQLLALGALFAPAERVTDCRDPKDNKYLELALAAVADAIVSSDTDLLVLHPWRGIRILLPADYLAEAGCGP